MNEERIGDGTSPMDNDRFEELCEGVRQMGEVMRGERLPERVWTWRGPLLIEVRERRQTEEGEQMLTTWRLSEAVAALPDGADAAEIREALRLSQEGFARLLGISVGTLRGWEQGRRAPQGAALTLLQIAARHPEVLAELCGDEASVEAA